jgi:membrane protein implicated in regulation of membrane protease activity
MTAFAYSSRHAVAVDADAATADRALRDVTFGEVSLVRALVFARGLGLPPRHEPVLQAIGRRATVVEDVPGEGVLFRLEGQFWRLRGRGREPAATATVRFRAVPGLLATETHVSVPAASQPRFRRYWCVVRPFSGLIRTSVLRAAKRRAEAGA